LKFGGAEKSEKGIRATPYNALFCMGTRQLPRMPSFAEVSKGNSGETWMDACVFGKAQLAVEII
jgi:hypothetical protein